MGSEITEQSQLGRGFFGGSVGSFGNFHGREGAVWRSAERDALHVGNSVAWGKRELTGGKMHVVDNINKPF
jgi:hypothetical protein